MSSFLTDWVSVQYEPLEAAVFYYASAYCDTSDAVYSIVLKNKRFQISVTEQRDAQGDAYNEAKLISNEFS